MAMSDWESKARALGSILDVARQLSRPFELAELLAKVIDVGRDVVHADRGSVFLLDAESQELYTVVAHGVEGIRFSVDKGIAGECAQSRQVINVPDCYADARFNQAIDKETGYRTNCLIAVPLVGLDDELVGVMQLLNAADGVFSEHDEYLTTLVASQAATAIQRVRLMDDRIERLKLEEELELARRIQLGVLPKALPTCGGYDIATFINPAEQTGGDIFDVVALGEVYNASSAGDASSALESDDAGNDDAKKGAGENSALSSIFLLLADATGHGVGPAISVTQVRAMLRVGLRFSASLDDLFRHINDQLTADLTPERFVTAFMGILNPVSHEIVYHAAGQAPLLHYHAAERTCEFLDASTIPLGIMSEPPVDAISPIRMQPGDMFILLTDGMYEYMNPANQQMGNDRIAQVVQANSDASANEILELLLEAMNSFADGAPQLDDVTAVVVKREA